MTYPQHDWNLQGSCNRCGRDKRDAVAPDEETCEGCDPADCFPHEWENSVCTKCGTEYDGPPEGEAWSGGFAENH